eukprot:CAMPEP_0116554754 /NCGR_PEP_ID=MMETSP0397-20121206/7765_1 /TAXON_ID=216820 /ORGANISM="Cyclophora tenuis, Strain ECT3854" /LENGTH=163 /DNA_ID=CAMNT_0004079945 /DNA_START=582 /DNA_END=1073 /DNA_ORIENTATION=-
MPLSPSTELVTCSTHVWSLCPEELMARSIAGLFSSFHRFLLCLLYSFCLSFAPQFNNTLLPPFVDTIPLDMSHELVNGAGGNDEGHWFGNYEEVKGTLDGLLWCSCRQCTRDTLNNNLVMKQRPASPRAPTFPPYNDDDYSVRGWVVGYKEKYAQVGSWGCPV